MSNELGIFFSVLVPIYVSGIYPFYYFKRQARFNLITLFAILEFSDSEQ